MKLSQRKNDILIATVEDYIKDASPITSSAIKDRHIKDVSSATLRSELNALEAMGFLKQIYTSGGRIPTTAGYRYYVEYLFSSLKFDSVKIERVKEILNEKTRSVNEIITELAKIISEATNSSTVVMMNDYNNLIVEEIKIVSLINDTALILIRTKSGIVNNTIKTTAEQKSCDDAARLLTKRFVDKTIGHMIKNIEEVESVINKEVNDYKDLIENLLSGLKELAGNRSMGIKADSIKLLESGELSDAKRVFNILEDEDQLEKILKTERDEITCNFSDDENGALAVVKAPIIVGGKNIGMVGVLGPQRMDYMLVASALKFVTSELENLDKLEDKKWQKNQKK